MGLKQLLTAVMLCASASVAWAQSTAYGSGAKVGASADSVYYEVDLEELMSFVHKLSQSKGGGLVDKAEAQTPLLTALRYRLLMNLLAQPRPAIVQSSTQAEPSVQKASAKAKAQGSTQALERRIALLEQAVQSLLRGQERAQGSQLLMLNAPQRQGNTPSTLNASPVQDKPSKSAKGKLSTAAVDTDRVQVVDTVRVQVVDTLKVIPAMRIQPIAQIIEPQAKATPIPLRESRVDTLRIVEVRQDTVLVHEPARLERTVFFPVGASRITAEGKLTLGSVVEYLRHKPAERLRLKGYASPEGDLQTNLRLAKARTEAVRLYLLSRGIAEDRLEVVEGGLGSSTISPQLDRRVQLEAIR